MPLNDAQLAYALRFVRNSVGGSVSRLDLDAAAWQAVFDALSRREERESAVRDEWGNWDWISIDVDRRHEYRTPWLDRNLAAHLNIDTVARPRWPDGKRFALCLTHDVDSVSHRRTPFASVVEAVRRLGGDGTARERSFMLVRACGKYVLQAPRLRGGPDPIWHYEDWLRVEAQYGFRSTFFGFPEHVAKPHACDADYRMRDRVVFDRVRMTAGEMLRRIAESGWEVGVHGSFHSALDATILRDEREQIERAIGADVRSVRQHYLHYDAARTPAVQYAAGLYVDSTLGFNGGIGFRSGTALPYWCWDWSEGDELPLLEIPQHVMDGAVFRDFAPGGADDGLARVLRLVDDVQAVGGCLTLNWHPEYLNHSRYWDMYVAVLEHAHRRNAWGCSVRDIYDWWLRRDRMLDGAHAGGQRTVDIRSSHARSG
ncbi:MAG TPA: polysaccharide deacetylase family protein [Gemmatimonadaceae bacterium]|nr:polysaccharide deacetylase family protein [Gemmatimonadaceae bacterium]